MNNWKRDICTKPVFLFSAADGENVPQEANNYNNGLLPQWPIGQFSRGINDGGIDRLSRLEFQRMANWSCFDKKNEAGRMIRNRRHVSCNSPCFDQKIETGPVGHPLELRSCKLGQSHEIPLEKCPRWYFLTSPGENAYQSVENPVLLSGTVIIVGLKCLPKKKWKKHASCMHA